MAGEGAAGGAPERHRRSLRVQSQPGQVERLAGVPLGGVRACTLPPLSQPWPQGTVLADVVEGGGAGAPAVLQRVPRAGHGAAAVVGDLAMGSLDAVRLWLGSLVGQVGGWGGRSRCPCARPQPELRPQPRSAPRKACKDKGVSKIPKMRSRRETGSSYPLPGSWSLAFVLHRNQELNIGAQLAVLNRGSAKARNSGCGSSPVRRPLADPRKANFPAWSCSHYGTHRPGNSLASLLATHACSTPATVIAS